MPKSILLVDFADTRLTKETTSICEDIATEYGYSHENLSYAHVDKKAQIPLLPKADVIVAMGAEVVRALLPDAPPLKKLAGALTYHAELDTWIIPTIHPNVIYTPEGKGYNQFDIFYDHMRRAIDLCQETLAFPPVGGHKLDWEFIGHNGTQGYDGDPKVWSGYFEATEEEIARQWELLDYWLFDLEVEELVFGLDTESFTTNHFKPMTMIQLYDPRTRKGYAFNWGVVKAQTKLWQQLFRHKRAKFVLHNTKHDRKMLKHWLDVDLQERDDDTMAWALGLTEKGNQTGLKYLSRQYCNAPFYEEGLDEWLDNDKAKINYGHIRPDVLAEYGCLDVFYTHSLSTILPNLCEREGTADLVRNILLPAQRTFSEIEYTGVSIDQKFASQLQAEWQPMIDSAIKEVQDYAREMGFPRDPELVKAQVSREICDCVPVQLCDELSEIRCTSYGKYLRDTHSVNPECQRCNKRRYVRLIDDTLNVRSHVQMQHLCFDVLGMDETYEGRKTNKYFWQLNPAHEFTKLVMAYRQLDYLNTNIIQGFDKFIREDGRIHPNFWLSGTVTGRLSASEPPVHGIPKHGKNAKRLRQMVLPDSGDVIVDCDYSNLELYMAHHLTGDEALLEGLQKDLHRTTAAAMYMVDYSEVTDVQRQSAKPVNFGCVPLETKVLTPGGWKTHEQVQVGDQTLGYNPKTGQSEWTEITEVHHYSDAPTVLLKGGYNWHATTTANHNWYTRNQWGLERFETTTKMSSGSNILLSAPADTPGTGLNITPDEAAIIGWLVTDGTFKFIKGNGIVGRIYQKKIEGLADIRRLLKNIDHTVRFREKTGMYWFFLRAVYLRDLAIRANLDNLRIDEEWILQLDNAQRSAFLEAAHLAEGHTLDTGVRIIGQNVGDVQRAIALAAYMSGHFVRDFVENCPGGTAPHHRMRLGKAHITNQRLKRTAATVQDVWCVTTGLGTWTMLHDGQTMLTGNSGYNIGPAKLARDINLIGVTGGKKDKAQEFLDAFWAKYHVWDAARAVWLDDAMTNCELRTETGRVRRWNLITQDNMWKIKNQSANFKGQSLASDLCLTSVIRLQKELRRFGYGRVILTVHDSVVLSIHKGQVHNAVRLIKQIMTDPVFETETPFKVDVQVGLNYGETEEYDLDLDYKTW